MQVWMCTNCGWHFDPEAGSPQDGIAPGTAWEDLPETFECPLCGAARETFELTDI